MVMRLSSIEFGSLLTYSPRGTSDGELRSKTTMRMLKGDEFVSDPPILMSDFIAGGIKNSTGRLPFARYFENNPILVPTPNSSLTRPGTLWVPQRLANALVRKGLGNTVSECLKRVIPLQKAATSFAADRPKAFDHYTSMEVQKVLSEPSELLLIDDVVTRGATLLGAANKLADVFPNARIRAFAAMRTISTPDDFRRILDPCDGIIEDNGYGDTFRRP